MSQNLLWSAEAQEKSANRFNVIETVEEACNRPRHPFIQFKYLEFLKINLAFNDASVHVLMHTIRLERVARSATENLYSII